MDKVIKSYSMKINKKSKSKMFYYLRRDLIGYGKMDVLMNDVNVEDISLDGTNVPIFAYHRKFESVETTCVWETDEELGILRHQTRSTLWKAHFRRRTRCSTLR